MRACLRKRLAAVILAAGFAAAARDADAQAIWAPGINDLYSNPANWSGGVLPPNDGSATINFPLNGTYNYVYVDTDANVAGISFNGPSSYADYYFQEQNSGTLTIGSGGISSGSSGNAYLAEYVPLTLSANQTWSSGGYIFAETTIGENAGSPVTLTATGNIYLLGASTFSGGLIVTPFASVYIGDTGAGTGPVTIGDNATFGSYVLTATVPGPVSLGNNVTFGTSGFASYGNTLNFNGDVTLANANTTLSLANESSVYINGDLAGPASSQLSLYGQGVSLPHDGGSQLIFSGALSGVASLTLSSVEMILAPTGSPAGSTASLSPAGLQVTNTSYLGFDGSFTNANAVSSFLSTFGAAMGPTFSGTLGFDSYVNVANPGATNKFYDPIDLSQFSSSDFLGLGTTGTATLSASAVITPYQNVYLFGGGGGALTVISPLTDNGATPRSLFMTAADTPLTVLVQGTADYTGGTVSSGGVLIFDAPVPLTGMIQNSSGYVGSTELATNLPDAQHFVDLFAVNSNPNPGVIGFDATDPGAGRTVSGDINLSAFTGGTTPFLGTATDATLTATIEPANSTYAFAAVKGGRLTVATSLPANADSVVIGLLNPIENLGTNSVVNMAGSNAYTGGTVFNSGTLFVNNDNALGMTGQLSVPNDGSAQYTPYLAPYGPGNVTLSIPIGVAPFQIYNPGISLGDYTGTTPLTLTGPISDLNPSVPAAIGINGPVTLTSSLNTYSGGTVFVGGSYSVLTLTPGAVPGTGAISTQSPGAIIPSLGNVAINNDINIYNALTLGSADNTNLLTIGTAGGSNGAISGYGTLDIESDVTLNGASSLTGTVYIYNALVTLGNETALGTGSVELSNSQLAFALPNLDVTSLTGDGSIQINQPTVSTLTIDVEQGGYPSTFTGSISGGLNAGVIKTGPGAEYLGGPSTYGGGTLVNGGTLFAGNAQALGTGPVQVAASAQLSADDTAVVSNSVTLDSGASLAGGGTFSPAAGIIVSGGSIVQPGSPLLGKAVETLNFGTGVTFGAGGIYEVAVEDATGSAGVGYSSISVSAPLTITATAGASNQFTVAVSAIDTSYGDVGPASNFNASQSYSWTLLSATSISGFSSSAFLVDSSLFAAQNPLMGGSFSIDEVNGNTLTLDFTPVPEPSTWILLGAGSGLVGFGSWRRFRAAAVRS